jgi:hypothetical protein
MVTSNKNIKIAENASFSPVFFGKTLLVTLTAKNKSS